MCSVLKFSKCLLKFPCIFHSVSHVLVCGLHMLTPDSMDIQNGNKWLPSYSMVYIHTPRHFKERSITVQKTCKYHGNTMETSKRQWSEKTFSFKIKTRTDQKFSKLAMTLWNDYGSCGKQNTPPTVWKKKKCFAHFFLPGAANCCNCCSSFSPVSQCWVYPPCLTPGDISPAFLTKYCTAHSVSGISALSHEPWPLKDGERNILERITQMMK